jgi:hypothetical protein
MVPFISSTVITLAVSMASISLAHALRTSSSACDIVFTHSFVYPSGPGDLFAFKQLSTKLLNSLSVNPAFESCPGVYSCTFVEHPCIEKEAHVSDILSTVAKMRVLPTVFTKAR